MKKIFVIILCAVLTITLVITACVYIPCFITQQKTEKGDNALTSQKILKVPELSQYPELPTGCEAACAAMVLNYYDVNITAPAFAQSWLEYDEDFEEYEDKLYGPNPNEVFVGNPFSEYSYGCYAPAIAKAVNSHSVLCEAEVIKYKSVKQLCSEYIDNDKPLLLWVTTGMKESKIEDFWYLEDDTYFYWLSGEHVMVLVGYNEDFYFLNDPTLGSTVAYKKEIVEKRFLELGQQAVYIDRVEKSENY